MTRTLAGQGRPHRRRCRSPAGAPRDRDCVPCAVKPGGCLSGAQSSRGGAVHHDILLRAWKLAAWCPRPTQTGSQTRALGTWTAFRADGSRDKKTKCCLKKMTHPRAQDRKAGAVESSGGERTNERPTQGHLARAAVPAWRVDVLRVARPLSWLSKARIRQGARRQQCTWPGTRARGPRAAHNVRRAPVHGRVDSTHCWCQAGVWSQSSWRPDSPSRTATCEEGQASACQLSRLPSTPGVGFCVQPSSPQGRGCGLIHRRGDGG